MFRKIKEITFKISPYCNLNCEYCFQSKEIKEDKRIFNLYDELISFINKIPLDNTLEFKLTGGETSLLCDEIDYAYKRLKKLERHMDTRVIFTTITNGTNLEGIIDLMDRNILDSSGCKYSWDGICSSSKSRKPKDNTCYTDDYFNNKIRLLGQSEFRDKMLIRTAISPSTIDDLSNSVEYLLDCGCTKWEYYFLTDCKEYKNMNFLYKFRRELEKIARLYEKYEFDYYNWKALYFTEKVLTKVYKDRLRSVNCRHLGRSLYIGMDGDISPCGFFSDDCMYEGCKLFIGNIFDGFYKNTLDKFIKEYSMEPMCNYGDCSNMHCFECPAMSKHKLGHLQHKIKQTCLLRTIEKDIFLEEDSMNLDKEKVRMMFGYTNDWHVEPSLPDFLPYKKEGELNVNI